MLGEHFRKNQPKKRQKNFQLPIGHYKQKPSGSDVWLVNRCIPINNIYILWNYYISMSIHVHFYREQSAVTLILCVQHSKNRLCAETTAALLQTPLLDPTAAPQQCAVWTLWSINMGAEKNMQNKCTANGVCVNQAWQCKGRRQFGYIGYMRFWRSYNNRMLYERSMKWRDIAILAFNFKLLFVLNMAEKQF